MFYPRGNLAASPLPGTIEYIIVRQDSSIAYAIRRRLSSAPGTIDPFIAYPHFRATIYSPSLSNTLELISPEWVMCHYACWNMDSDRAVVLTLSRLHQQPSKNPFFATANQFQITNPLLATLLLHLAPTSFRCQDTLPCLDKSICEERDLCGAHELERVKALEEAEERVVQELKELKARTADQERRRIGLEQEIEETWHAKRQTEKLLTDRLEELQAKKDEEIVYVINKDDPLST
ncbi:hypothetical protein GALMADRAFT_141602 [Galerina marginata CBS 339.88]|uniref:Uncharacterized protein n=1 Tax=Galerina marginata (strain CBS 339.88) TaxID=685588 RepID=A0A067SUI4_GALM3|nr:hypothetical protein GALMADRAFT_141602 [Galerina marginata CBS 339.88]